MSRDNKKWHLHRGGAGCGTEMLYSWSYLLQEPAPPYQTCSILFVRGQNRTEDFVLDTMHKNSIASPAT